MTPSFWNEATEITDAHTLELHRGAAAVRALEDFLAPQGTIIAWLYTIDLAFVQRFIKNRLAHSQVYLITDYRTRARAAEIASTYRTFHARSWSANRTMHDKTLVHTTNKQVLITTANGTVGAWTLSRNRTFTLTSHQLTSTLIEEFWENWKTTRTIIPATNRYLHLT